METIPSIGAGQNQVIGTGLILGDDYTSSFTPTLTKIFRQAHAEDRRKPPDGGSQLLPEQQHGGHVHLHQRADGARWHESGFDGGSLRIVPNWPANGRYLSVIES